MHTMAHCNVHMKGHIMAHCNVQMKGYIKVCLLDTMHIMAHHLAYYHGVRMIKYNFKI